MKTLAEIRAEIDSIDSKLIPLLEARLAIAADVAAAKRAEGRPIDDPVRERTILDTVAARVSPASADSLRQIYRVLFAESKKHQYHALARRELVARGGDHDGGGLARVRPPAEEGRMTWQENISSV